MNQGVRESLRYGWIAAVLAQETDLVSLNVSGLLSSYVALLLAGGDVTDLERLGTDEPRREHLLGWSRPC